MSDKINTGEHNVNVLHSLGYQRVKNTTIFKNGDEFILSPSVSKNVNGGYWFDLREVNLDKINENSLILVRIVPDLFIIEPIKSIYSLLPKQEMENRPNSGNVWGIGINFNEKFNRATLFNKGNKLNKTMVKVFGKLEINEVSKELIN